MYFRVMCLFFFFQAEDGIRDIGVTGVQTCALPICRDAAVTATRLPTRRDMAVSNDPLIDVRLPSSLVPLADEPGRHRAPSSAGPAAPSFPAGAAAAPAPAATPVPPVVRARAGPARPRARWRGGPRCPLVPARDAPR